MVQGRTDNAVKNRYMAICKKVDRGKDKSKSTPRRYSRAETVSRGSSALSTPVGNRKRPMDGSFSDSSPSGKRRLCPSPQGMLTIQIPPADDGPNGTTGLPSALKSLATLTAAELQMLTEVGLNPFNAPPTAQGSDTQLGTRTRSGGLGLGLGLGSTPSGALNLGGTPMSMDMTEVVKWLTQNPLPTPTPGSVSENIKLWDSAVDAGATPSGSLSRRNSLRGPSNLSPARSLRPSGSFGASGSGAAAGFAGSSGNTSGSLDEQQVARLQALQKILLQKKLNSQQVSLTGTSSGDGLASALLPTSPVRRSPRISMSHLTSSHSNLDPEILASPTFSQNELSMLLNALSDGGPTPTRSGGLAATVAAAEAASPRRSPRVKAPML